MITTILFDLDGTLVDTAIGLHQCLSEVLIEYQRPLISLQDIKHHINVGALGFIKMGFPDITDDKQLELLKQQLLDKYEYLLTHKPSHLFDGIRELLETLLQKQYQLGIVTNKYQRFTLPLLAQLGLTPLFKTIICGDMVNQAKPAPDSLLLACHDLNISTQQAVYIGDSMVDVLAADHAKITMYLAGWGYKSEEVAQEAAQNINVLKTPADLLTYLN